MTIWAIGDLHLSFGVSNKKMDLFGPQWENHAEKIEKAWREKITPEDLVLIPGDISWAMKLEDVVPDFQWIEQLPGTKVILKGNHDYWWSSLSKISSILPPSCHLIQNNSFEWNGVSIGGTRLWDSDTILVKDCIDYNANIEKKSAPEEDSREREKIFQRELDRLELSLKTMNSKANLRIVMTHYPPLGIPMVESAVTQLLEKYNIQVCVFGHLHNIKKGLNLYGTFRGIQYFLTSCDYLDFTPIQIVQ